MTNGGVFNGSVGGILVGDQSTGVGNVSVDGSGSKLLLGTTFGADVGEEGNGTLSVTNGAVVDGGGGELELGLSVGGKGGSCQVSGEVR